MDINDINEFVKDDLENNNAGQLIDKLNDFVDDTSNANISGLTDCEVQDVMWAEADVVNKVYDVDSQLNEDDSFEATATISATIIVNDRFADTEISDSVELQYEIKVYGKLEKDAPESYIIEINDIEILNQLPNEGTQSEIKNPERFF